MAFAGLIAATSPSLASTHHRHRHVAKVAPEFVFGSPAAAAYARFNGQVGGVFESGILGPVTANPYEHPAVGYGAYGYYGPGPAYPGY